MRVLTGQAQGLGTDDRGSGTRRVGLGWPHRWGGKRAKAYRKPTAGYRTYNGLLRGSARCRERTVAYDGWDPYAEYTLCSRVPFRSLRPLLVVKSELIAESIKLGKWEGDAERCKIVQVHSEG